MPTASLLLIVFSLLLLVVSVSTLYLATYAWWDPDQRSRTGYPGSSGETAFSFSLLMPCRAESESVMRPTLERLLGQTHPEVEVIISVGHDDPATVAIAERLAAEHPDRVFVASTTATRRTSPAR